MTTQLVRNEVTSWEKVFPPDQRTKQQSVLFMKKLLAVAVSNITYLRALFPEYAFGNRALEGLQLKILKEETCPKASRLIKWLKGCFDALEKQYLRHMIIGLYEKDSDPDCVIESYNFHFTYQDGYSMTMDKDNSNAEIIKANTKKSTISLLRAILSLTAILKPLPNDIKMVIKLHYYDDVTPPSYQPPGFVDCPNENFIYQSTILNLDLGSIETPFNTLKLRIKTDGGQFGTQENPNESQLEHGNESVNQTLQINDCVEPTEEKDKKHEHQLSDSANDIKGIRCACNDNKPDGFMITCLNCNYSQHGVCFRILKETNAPDIHICHLCVKLKNPSRQPTDHSLVSLSALATQATCIWRRTIVSCLKSSFVNGRLLAKRFGLNYKVADEIITRLKDEGFVGKRLSKQGHTVLKKKIESIGISKYFNLIDKKATDDKTEPNENNLSSIDEVTILSEKTKELSVLGLKKTDDRQTGKGTTVTKGKKRYAFDRLNGQEFAIASSGDTTFYGGGNVTPVKKWKTSRASPALSV